MLSCAGSNGDGWLLTFDFDRNGGVVEPAIRDAKYTS